MAVFYKFKSAKNSESVAVESPFISVGDLKHKIVESKHLGRRTDFELLVSNAQTNEEYVDDAMLIPRNTSVVVRRIPRRRGNRIVIEREESEILRGGVAPPKNGFQCSDLKFPDDSECDEFGIDLYAVPEVPQGWQTQTQTQTQLQPAIQNKGHKTKRFVDLSARKWQRQTQESYNSGGGGLADTVFGRGAERKSPADGYVCHRCKVPGHFIQHCPTNGDPSYDIKRVKPPTGIPKTAVSEKEIEGFPPRGSAGELPPELRCPLCNEVMKDAVVCSKCCFKSYCDKCIREHIISKSRCVCGATDIAALDLLPNNTLRDTINRILESSGENGGSRVRVADMESAHKPVPSQSDVPNGKESTSPVNESTKCVEPSEEKLPEAKKGANQGPYSREISQGCVMLYPCTADGYVSCYGGSVPYMGYGHGSCGATMPYGTLGYTASARDYMCTYNCAPAVRRREERERGRADLRRKRKRKPEQPLGGTEKRKHAITESKMTDDTNCN